MKKPLLFTLFTALMALLSSCSTIKPVAPLVEPPPEAPAAAVHPVAPTLESKPEVTSPLLIEMQTISTGILEAGGLAAIGSGGSKSLDLALNRAKANGRIELTRLLTARVEALAQAFAAETGLTTDSLVLSQFSEVSRTIRDQQIAGRVAQTLKYETAADTFTAYALMVIDPSVITNQLAKEKTFFARLQPTKAFQDFDKQLKAYQAFAAAQK